MQSRTLIAISTTLLVLAIIAAPSAAAATYKITVMTNASSYSGAQTLTASGVVSPAPGPNTAVFLQIFNPSAKLVAVGNAPVDGSTGAYQDSIVLGGPTNWIAGTYTVNATWGNTVTGPHVSLTTSFTYSPAATTTTSTTTTTTTTSTTTTSTTSTSTSSTTSSTTSTTSTTTTPTTTTTTTSPTTTTTSSSTTSKTTTITSPPTQTTTSSSSTSTSSSSGGIPEFPFQLLAVSLFTLFLVASYLLARRHWTPSGLAGPSLTNALNRGIRCVG